MNAKRAKELRREVYGAGSKRETPVTYDRDHRALGKRGAYRRAKAVVRARGWV